MNISLIGRIAWKEYRQQRPLFLSVTGLSIVAQLAVVMVAASAGNSVPVEGLFVIGLGMSVLYAAACGGMLFAGEDEAGTIGFLRSIPVTSHELLTGKVGFACVSTLLLMAVLWLGTLAITQGSLPDPTAHARIWLFCLVACMEMLAWSVLCSLLLRRVLGATLLAGCIAMVVATIWLVGTDGRSVDANAANLFPLFGNLATALVVAVAVAFAVNGWLGKLPVAMQISWPQIPWPQIPWPAPRHELREKHVAEKPSRRERHPVGRRMVWQAWRQSAVARWLVLAFALVHGSLVVWISMRSMGESFPVLSVLPPLGAIMGVSVFAADQRQLGFRFFAERGIQPRMMWLSRHLIWGGFLCVAILILAVATWQDLGFHMVSVAVGEAVLYYAIGQACSLFIRRTLLAFVATIAGWVTASTWQILNSQLGVPLIFAVWPFAPILLFATWLRMPHWMAECSTGRARLRAIGSIVIPGAVLMITVGIYRAAEIPQVPPPYDRSNITRPATTAERAAPDQYRDVWNQLENADPNARDILSNDLVRQFIAATRKDECRFSMHGGAEVGRQAQLLELAKRVAKTAEAAEQDGRLDEALEIHWALLRFANQLYSQPSLDRLQQGLAVEKLVRELLPRWAARPGHSSEQILEALKTLNLEFRRTHPNWKAAVASQYDRISRSLDAEPGTIKETLGSTASKLRALGWYGTAEKIRMRRLLDVMATAELEQMGQQSTVHFAYFRGSPYQDDPRIERWLESTPYVRGLELPVSSVQSYGELGLHRYVTLLQLGMVAWQIEHHKLPTTLDELVKGDLKDILREMSFLDTRIHYLPNGCEVFDAESGTHVPGSPCFWTPGRRLRFLPSGSGEEASLSEQYWIGGGPVTSESEVWQYGTQFPIPLVLSDELP